MLYCMPQRFVTKSLCNTVFVPVLFVTHSVRDSVACHALLYVTMLFVTLYCMSQCCMSPSIVCHSSVCHALLYVTVLFVTLYCMSQLGEQPGLLWHLVRHALAQRRQVPQLLHQRCCRGPCIHHLHHLQPPVSRHVKYLRCNQYVVGSTQMISQVTGDRHVTVRCTVLLLLLFMPSRLSPSS